VKLAVLALCAACCLAASGSCDSNRPGPNPVPTIATVVVSPMHPEAGTECALACERRKSDGCPSGNAMKSLEHGIAICTAGRVQLEDPTADCLCLIAMCNERCKP
jgi:hypothetical protein